MVYALETSSELVGKRTKELETPAVFVEIDIVDKNIAKMAEIMKKVGINHRPHIKTHKSIFLAKMQQKAGIKGITCAKLGEAETFAEAGFDDILLAFPIVGEKKLARFQALAERISLKTVCDSYEVAEGLSSVGEKMGKKVQVLIEVDGGSHRCGRQPGEDTIQFAKGIKGLPGLEIVGILVYAGHVYGVKEKDEIREFAKEEAKLSSEVANQLRAEGFDIQIVSAGSSLTQKFADVMEGVTELRAGNYIFHDQAQLATGMVNVDECALRVVATVVSATSSGHAIIDAGTKTLTSDKASFATGFGYVLEHPEIEIYNLNEEHGYLRFPENLKLFIGEKLTIIPNHSCMLPNLCDKLIGVRDDKVVCVFPVSARGMNK